MSKPLTFCPELLLDSDATGSQMHNDLIEA